MSAFLGRLQAGFQNFMLGRYGIDQLSVAITIAALVLYLLGSFAGFGLLSAVAIIGIAYSIFRCYSRDTAARTRELAAFDRIAKKPTSWVSLQVKRWKNRSTTCYFTCKNCGTVYSVPKGKGTLRVTCPTCREKSVHAT